MSQFKANNSGKTAVAWDRGNLLEWRASLPKARRGEDCDSLARLFNYASQIPILKDALYWAETHNIDFVIDHTVAAAAGYYTIGTGVVALGKEYRHSVGVLVHEIRHAWQDYHGMIPTGGKSFAGYFMRVGLMEADATAYQMLAERQYIIACNLRRAEKNMRWFGDEDARQELDRMTAQMEDTKQESGEWLRSGFKEWYDTKAITYGVTARRAFGHALGVPSVTLKNYKFEYQPYRNRQIPAREGIDIERYDDLARLGKDFKGRHYFNAASREFLFRKALSPDRAATFFSKSEIRYPEVEEIRRRQLLLRHHKGQDIMINVHDP